MHGYAGNWHAHTHAYAHARFEDICIRPSLVGVNGLLRRYVGMGVAAVKKLFAKARKHKKSIIYIDEIDYLGRSRNRLEKKRRRCVFCFLATRVYLLIVVPGDKPTTSTASDTWRE